MSSLSFGFVSFIFIILFNVTFYCPDCQKKQQKQQQNNPRDLRTADNCDSYRYISANLRDEAEGPIGAVKQ